MQSYDGSRKAGRVLLVDDDPVVRECTAALLDDDYEVVPAGSAEEAIAILPRILPDVVCTDFRMPGMSGLELIAHVHRHYPEVGRILISGHREYLAEQRERLVYSVLLKPYRADELMQHVERACRLGALRRELDQTSIRRRCASVTDEMEGARRDASSGRKTRS
jgi:two-component system response regulator HupR/HoxA